jgi:hypothetical protein
MKTKLSIFVLAISTVFFSTITSCKKETIIKTITIRDTVLTTIRDTILSIKTDTLLASTICPVSGVYAGTSITSGGISNAFSYNFQKSNFATGQGSVVGINVSFGGYENTCDSIFISVYYLNSSSYISLAGKLSNNRNTIIGTYNNKTNPSDFGTFTLTK